ncbi:E3 UFM1-protein ligase 1 [Linnemannia exigua]|uniref:E3 UFM1-protein ligase 1 n=1 Tax=Linnemannia exigua TaxID=604196 RepID=A0AAD4DJY4_9FUNG|nr:E3 UFM1-protein ligase 1 [Linnemannia exigua]
MTTTIWKTLFGQADNPDDLRGQDTLSEEACGDLIHSLARLGYLSNIATSLDGKAFITLDQLDSEILSELDKRNGRVSVLDLPRTLNANSSDIQDRIQGLIRSRPGRIFHIQDEVVKLEYFQDMTTQMNEELSQRGFITALEISRKYKFGIDFVRQFLKDRVGSTIPGLWDTVDRGLVIAPWFYEQEKASLLNTLHQLKEPTSLATLKAKHVVQEQLMYGLCDTLAKDTGLPGTFKGVGEQGTFVPQPYEQQQTDWIETFFKDNGFIELDAVKKRGVVDPKAYMQTNHPTVLILETHAVKESIWSIIDASVEDTIANLSWIDIKPLVPSPLTKEDISRLLQQLPSLKEPTSRIPVAPEQDPSLTGLNGGSPQESLVIQDSIVVTSGQFQKCLLRMGPLLNRKAKALLSWRLSFGGNANKDDFADGQEDADDFFPSTLSSSNDTASLRALLDQASSVVSDGSGQGSKKNKKGKQTQQQQQGAKANGKKQLRDFLTIQDIKEEIREMEPDFDSALVNATAGILYNDLLQNLKDRNRSMILRAQEEEEEGGEEEHDAANEEQAKATHEAVWSSSAVSEIQSLSKRIQLSSRGIDVFEDGTVKNSLSKYLLQSLCIELLDLTTLFLAVTTASTPSTTPGPSKTAEATRDHLQAAYTEHQRNQTESNSTEGKGPFLLPSEDTAILQSEFIPKTQVDLLKKLRKLTAGSGKQKSLLEYLDIWSGVVHNSSGDNNGLGKVDTTNANDSLKLSEHLEELYRVLVGIEPHSGSAALMLHIVTLIVFQKWTGRMLHASGKYVPRILRQLRSTIEKREQGQEQELQVGHAPSTQLSLLEKMLEQVLTNLKQPQDEESEAGSEQEAKQLWQSVHDLGIELTKQ